jgi:hypothetical protein
MKTKGGADAEWIFKILASTGALGIEYGYSYSKCEESTEKSRPTDRLVLAITIALAIFS